MLSLTKRFKVLQEIAKSEEKELLSTNEDTPTKETDDEKAKQLRRRRKILEEILSSEEKYHKQLDILIKYFKNPTEERNLMPKDVREKIFGNIDQIVSVNQELLSHLQDMDAGAAFLWMAPFLKLYSIYANNHEIALATLQEYEQKRPDFAKFRTGQETRPEVGMKLGGLLIIPIQRVPRYKLLLEDLLAHTDQDHDDYQSLQSATSQVSTVASHINNHIKEQENFRQMLAIQRSLDGDCAPRIVAPGRRFIKQGMLRRVSRKGDKSFDRMFFLFSDMMMYGKPRFLDGTRRYSCCCILPLHHCTIQRIFGTTGLGAMFKLTCKSEELLLYSDSQNMISEWIDALEKTIGTVSESRQTLRKESSAKQPMRRPALIRQKLVEKRKLSEQKELDDNTMFDIKEEGTGCSQQQPGTILRALYTNSEVNLCCTPTKRPKLSKNAPKDRNTEQKLLLASSTNPQDSFELVNAPDLNISSCVPEPTVFTRLSQVSLPNPIDCATQFTRTITRSSMKKMKILNMDLEEVRNQDKSPIKSEIDKNKHEKPPHQWCSIS